VLLSFAARPEGVAARVYDIVRLKDIVKGLKVILYS
jgi:hypothetical protein